MTKYFWPLLAFIAAVIVIDTTVLITQDDDLHALRDSVATLQYQHTVDRQAVAAFHDALHTCTNESTPCHVPIPSHGFPQDGTSVTPPSPITLCSMALQQTAKP